MLDRQATVWERAAAEPSTERGMLAGFRCRVSRGGVARAIEEISRQRLLTEDRQWLWSNALVWEQSAR